MSQGSNHSSVTVGSKTELPERHRLGSKQYTTHDSADPSGYRSDSVDSMEDAYTADENDLAVRRATVPNAQLRGVSCDVDVKARRPGDEDSVDVLSSGAFLGIPPSPMGPIQGAAEAVQLLQHNYFCAMQEVSVVQRQRDRATRRVGELESEVATLRRRLSLMHAGLDFGVHNQTRRLRSEYQELRHAVQLMLGEFQEHFGTAMRLVHRMPPPVPLLPPEGALRSGTRSHHYPAPLPGQDSGSHVASWWSQVQPVRQAHLADTHEAEFPSLSSASQMDAERASPRTPTSSQGEVESATAAGCQQLQSALADARRELVALQQRCGVMDEQHEDRLRQLKKVHRLQMRTLREEVEWLRSVVQHRAGGGEKEAAAGSMHSPTPSTAPSQPAAAAQDEAVVEDAPEASSATQQEISPVSTPSLNGGSKPPRAASTLGPSSVVSDKARALIRGLPPADATSVMDGLWAEKLLAKRGIHY